LHHPPAWHRPSPRHTAERSSLLFPQESTAEESLPPLRPRPRPRWLSPRPAPPPSRATAVASREIAMRARSIRPFRRHSRNAPPRILLPHRRQLTTHRSMRCCPRCSHSLWQPAQHPQQQAAAPVSPLASPPFGRRSQPLSLPRLAGTPPFPIPAACAHSQPLPHNEGPASTRQPCPTRSPPARQWFPLPPLPHRQNPASAAAAANPLNHLEGRQAPGRPRCCCCPGSPLRQSRSPPPLHCSREHSDSAGRCARQRNTATHTRSLNIRARSRCPPPCLGSAGQKAKRAHARRRGCGSRWRRRRAAPRLAQRFHAPHRQHCRGALSARASPESCRRLLALGDAAP